MSKSESGWDAILRSTLAGSITASPDLSAGREGEFFDYLASHGVTALLAYRDFNTGCCENWPDTLRNQIKKSAAEEALVEKMQMADLCLVLARLQEQDIHPLLLKGAALSYSFYPAAGLRPRADTDLLIDVRDRQKVLSIMRNNSYQSMFEIDSDYLSSQIMFVKQERGNILHAYDIHWNVSNTSSSFNEKLTYAKLTGSAQPVRGLGENARMPSTVDTLLIACFHRALNYAYAGDRIIWLYDIHLLLENMSDDELRSFIRNAEKYKVLSISLDAIAATREWFHTQLPGWMNEISVPTDTEEISATYLVSGRLAGIKNHVLLDLRELPSWQNRIAYLLARIFPPVNYMKWRYHIKHNTILPVYYLYRLLYALYVYVRG